MGEIECIDIYAKDTGRRGRVVPGKAIGEITPLFGNLSIPKPRCTFLPGCKCWLESVLAARSEQSLSSRARVPPIFDPPSARP